MVYKGKGATMGYGDSGWLSACKACTMLFTTIHPTTGVRSHGVAEITWCVSSQLEARTGLHLQQRQWKEHTSYEIWHFHSPLLAGGGDLASGTHLPGGRRTDSIR